MELSHQDSLRLNVLLSQPLQAVRIDESRMVVHGLLEQGEAKVTLNPTVKDEQYLRRIRELLSTHFLGSPGGYPVYLRRWTRMGQARDDSLGRLLLLGEPEAVVAVVHAPGLTGELARRAWWAGETAENARRMLERQCVVQGPLGHALASYLIEYLPFEQDHQAMIDSVRLALQPGLIEQDIRLELWNRGQRKKAYWVGFLQAVPDELPLSLPHHPLYQQIREPLEALAARTNPYAAQLLRTLSGAGQAYLHTAATLLRKPANQDVVVELLEALGAYFAPVVQDHLRPREVDSLIREVTRYCEGDKRSGQIEQFLQAVPALGQQFEAMLRLAMVSEQLVVPIFGRSDAIGSVMRRHIQPVTDFIMAQIGQLLGGAQQES
jgi:hypothetical protein